MSRTICFLSDFGLRDVFVGVCHAVLARGAPGSRVIDLTHDIPPGDVLAGALALAEGASYAPPDAVHLGVVDPGVGTARRAVALAAGRAHLVGPDNGLLVLAARRLGGPERAVAIDPGRVTDGPVSATFHGRDVFAPAAALLATGATLGDLGPEIDPGTLVTVEPRAPEVRQGRVATVVLEVDRFGNLRLGARPDQLEEAALAGDVVLEGAGRRHALRRVRTFGDLGGGELGLLVDSGGWLAAVANGTSAAHATGLGAGDAVVLSAPKSVG